jgi:hypothetical protein
VGNIRMVYALQAECNQPANFVHYRLAAAMEYGESQTF